MSENTDPIHALENFNSGGLPVNPLAPEQVRRLGDKRRRRQHSLYGAVAAVVVAVAIVPVAVLVHADDGNGKPPPVLSSTTPEPTPTEQPTPTFPENGVEISSESDIAKLVGTTHEFQAFVLAQFRKATQDGQQCPDAAHGIYVQKYDRAGFATGGVNSCGGYVALWVAENGVWKEALFTQDEWLCGDLTRFGVPDGFAGKCYGPKVVLGPDEDYGIRLGMTAEEVRAAGGSVQNLGGGTCALAFAPGDTPSVAKDGNNNSIGYISLTPDRGVVALFAQKNQVTPRGIQTGDSLADLKKAYPEGSTGDHAAWWVRIDATHSYRFDIEQDDTIGNISLVLDGLQGCYE